MKSIQSICWHHLFCVLVYKIKPVVSHSLWYTIRSYVDPFSLSIRNPCLDTTRCSSRISFTAVFDPGFSFTISPMWTAGGLLGCLEITSYISALVWVLKPQVTVCFAIFKHVQQSLYLAHPYQRHPQVVILVLTSMVCFIFVILLSWYWNRYCIA